MKTILLLGGAGIQGPDGTTSGRGPRARLALLAVLASTRGRSASRELLTAMIWPDSDTDRARHLLREALYRLREQLGDDALISAGDDLRLAEGAVECDVWQFERAVREGNWLDANRLYRGPFLDGIAFNGSAEFEHWLDAERVRLDGLHARALESLAADLATRGEWDRALTLWKRRATADPYNSRIALQVMAAMDASGDRGGALRHAALHAQLLAAELGAAPDPDVESFAARLRREPVQRDRLHSGNGDGAGNAAATAGVDRWPERGDQSSTRLPHPVLVESDTVRAAPELIARAHPEHGRSLLQWRHGTSGVLALGTSILLMAAFVGMRVLRVEPALNADRIAILPAQTSGADSTLRILRDGLVWALTLPFNSDVGPVAVDPGETLAAWSRWGVDGNISARDARRVARRLGAGQVAYAAVLGTPERFTIQLRVLSVSDGSTRLDPIEIEATRDNWQHVAARAGARLRARLSDAAIGNVADVSPEALQLYVEGMDEHRKGNWLGAGDRLFRAFELDSTFTPAAYRFALIHALSAPIVPMDSAPARFRAQRMSGGPKQLAALWMYEHVWRNRERLPVDQRRLLEAVIDSVNILWQQEQLPKLEKAAALFPNSAEASMLLGVAMYRAGQLLGRTEWAERAESALLRSWMLDSAIALKAPAMLADLAFLRKDARAHQRWSRVADRITWAWENPTGGSPDVTRGASYRRYLAAILGGKTAAIRDARIQYSHAWARGDEVGPVWAIRGLSISAYELDSLLMQMREDATNAEARQAIDYWASHAAAMSGRPRRALEALRAWTVDWSNPDTIAYHISRMAWAEFGFDSAASAEVLTIARTNPGRFEGQQHAAVCNAVLSKLRRGDTSQVAGVLATMPALDDTLEVITAWHKSYRRGTLAQQALCALVARGVLASVTTGSLTGLHRADSLMRIMPLNSADWWNYDLAWGYAQRGEYALATAAVRRQFNDSFPLQRLVLRLRQEGRWAALAGDTTAAITALKRYLVWRSSPEPSMVPQRDSVRAELAGLERRTWRSAFRQIVSRN